MGPPPMLVFGTRLLICACVSSILTGPTMNILEKQCSKCKVLLNVSSFNKKKTRKDGTFLYQTYCKLCNKINARKYYADNRKEHIKVIYQRKKKQIEKLRNYVLELLSNNACVDCGESSILTLEFDHRSNKNDNISNMIHLGTSLKLLKEEISKCDVRCANCHRAKTHKDQNSYRWQHVSNMRS
jgi:hypothetical protein